MKDDNYMNILKYYTSSSLQDFKRYLRTDVDLVVDDIRLVLDGYNSSFFLYEVEPGIYTFKDYSEDLLKNLQAEYKRYLKAIDVEFDDITMKTKLVVTAGIIAIRFHEKSFFSTILGFTPHWDYEHNNKYISQRIVNLSTT